MIALQLTQIVHGAQPVAHIDPSGEMHNPLFAGIGGKRNHDRFAARETGVVVRIRKRRSVSWYLPKANSLGDIDIASFVIARLAKTSKASFCGWSILHMKVCDRTTFAKLPQ